MRNTDYFKHKKVTIVGLARSGLACANLLYDLGARVFVTDNQDTDLLRLNAQRLKSKDIKVELGRHSREFIKDKDLIVVSPGVDNKSQAMVWAQEFNLPIISEVEVAWILCPATVIAVTGTNGKTTVTTLIGKIIEAQGKRAFVCGNIGSPFCKDVAKMAEDDFVSLEVSSFQLERIKTFKPKIAAILNFTCNHLDRYSDMQEYLKAKKRIFMNQDKSDYLVLNYQDPVVKGLAKEAKANIVYFSQNKDLNPNQEAVIAAGSILGIEQELCLGVFKQFKGVEHRLEYVAESNNIKFINDSKATTVDATLWALKNTLKPLILIAGGREIGNDYSIILDLLRSKVRLVILIGEAKQKMRDALEGVLPIEEAHTLEEAVNKAFALATSGDSVLLSPMCKSFDMFSDYEERGEVFKRAVYDLLKK